MRFRFAPALVLTLAAGWAVAPAAPVPKGKAKTLEEQLIGTWKFVPDDGRDRGYTMYIEYKPRGELEVRFEYTGGVSPADVYTGTYKVVEPDAKNPLGAIDWSAKYDTEVKAEVAKIDKLTDDELTEIDPDGVVERFERVKPEKKDK